MREACEWTGEGMRQTCCVIVNIISNISNFVVNKQFPRSSAANSNVSALKRSGGGRDRSLTNVTATMVKKYIERGIMWPVIPPPEARGEACSLALAAIQS